MSRLPMPRSQRWLMVALAVLMPVMLFVSWSLRLEAPLPEPANTALMLLDPVLGVAALVLLPRVLYLDGGAPGFTVDPVRERRALVFGTGAQQLQNKKVAKTVDGHARQAVGFTGYQAIAIKPVAGCQPLAPGLRLLKTTLEKGVINGFIAIEAPDAGADLRRR